MPPIANGHRRRPTAVEPSETRVGLDEQQGWWLIQSLLANPHKAHEVDGLDPEDLPQFDQRRWLRAIQQLHRGGIEPDCLAVAEKLHHEGSLEDLGGAGEPIRLADLAPYVSHFDHWIRTIQEAAARRRLETEANTIRRMISDPTVTNEEIAERLALSKDLLSGSRSKLLDRMSLEDMTRQHPEMDPPIIDGWAREGSVVNLVSLSKIGKSWLAYMILLSVAAGWDLFGMTCRRSRVLLIDNELKRSEIQWRINTVARAMGMDPSFSAGQVEIVSLRGRLRPITELERELCQIGKGDFGLIVFDALYRMLPFDMSENDNAAMAQVYNLEDRIAEATRSVIINIAHASKGSQTGKEITDVGAGAGSQSRAADAHIILRPHEDEGCTVMESACRSFPPRSPVGLRWEFPLWVPDGNLNPESLKGRKSGREAQKHTEDQQSKGVILARLQEQGALTVKKLISLTGYGRQRLERLVGQLHSEGKVAAKTVNIRGNQCDEFALVE